ncbi:MAG: hypothetical protein H7Y38_16800, partial [Armatimonadetes bacterium]|nr:hypothetical protein [Armatimonadota bacterium]
MPETILIPTDVFSELRERIAEIAPSLHCLPYTEDDTPVYVADAVALLRWIGGKRFTSLILRGKNIRWLHTASAGVDHVLTPTVRERCERGDLTLTDSGPAFAVAIGEFVLAWMLAVSHRL